MSRNSRKRNKGPWEQSPNGGDYATKEAFRRLSEDVGLDFFRDSEAFLKRFLVAQILGPPKYLDVFAKVRSRRAHGRKESQGKGSVSEARRVHERQTLNGVTEEE